MVLQAMVSSGYLEQAEADRYAGQPLGVLDKPSLLPRGCITAGNAGFLCDYALRYLEDKGLSIEEIERGGYTITTTLDPQVQAIAHEAATSAVRKGQPGVAEVINVIEPGQDSHDILAMTSSRDYGLDQDESQTVLPQASSMVGNGAGSVFKIFTAAAALENGYNLESKLEVPERAVVYGMGEGGAKNCPAGAYCVENAGTFSGEMTLREALAKSPNTPFVKLIESVGVEPTVDMAVRLGLRSYEDEGTFDGDNSIADYFRQHNLGSFTLGPTAVNPLELSNVAATLASDGVWCEPNPIKSIVDRYGDEVALDRPSCEQAVEPELAAGLAGGMAEDAVSGTAKKAAEAAGWHGAVAAKTGTTESHQSSAFLGFNRKFAAATYIYNDGTQTAPLCTGPVRQCAEGSLYGGQEAADSWFRMATRMPGAADAGLPAPSAVFDPKARDELLKRAVGMNKNDARAMLEDAGFRVRESLSSGQGAPKDEVVSTRSAENAGPDSTITLVVSDGSGARLSTRPSTPSPSPTREEPAPEEPSFTDEDLGRIADDIANLFR